MPVGWGYGSSIASASATDPVSSAWTELESVQVAPLPRRPGFELESPVLAGQRPSPDRRNATRSGDWNQRKAITPNGSQCGRSTFDMSGPQRMAEKLAAGVRSIKGLGVASGAQGYVVSTPPRLAGMGSTQNGRA